MLGRSARGARTKNRPHAACEHRRPRSTDRRPHCEYRKYRTTKPMQIRRCWHRPRLPSRSGSSPQQARIAIAERNAAEREQNNSEFTTLRLSESKDRSRALPSKSDDGASRESFRTCSSMTEAQPIQGTAKVKPRRGLIQNAKFTINGFSSRVRFQRCHSEEQSDEESVFVSFSRFPPFRLAGRSLPRRRPASVPRRLRPNPKPFVILSKVTDVSLRST